MPPTKFPYPTKDPKATVTLPVGRHVLELVVEDSAGQRSDPDQVVITVVAQAVVPTITGINPNHGAQGQTNLGITITGTHLDVVKEVRFDDNNIKATIGPESTPNRLVLSVSIGSGAALGFGSYTLVYSLDGGTANVRCPDNLKFEVTSQAAAPTITKIESSKGRQGESVTATITGTNLDLVTDVKFAAKGVDVTLGTAPGRTATSLPLTINIRSDADVGPSDYSLIWPGTPVVCPPELRFTIESSRAITGIVPNTGQSGEKQKRLTISGHGLKGVKQVYFTMPDQTIVPGSFPAIDYNMDVTYALFGGDESAIPVTVDISTTQGDHRICLVYGLQFPASSWDDYLFSPPNVVFTVLPSARGFLDPSGIQLAVETGHRANEINGIGPILAQRLADAGVTTADEVARMEANRLAEILKVSENRAMRFIDAARRLAEEPPGG